MTLRERIRMLVEAGDPAGTVTIGWLGQLLEDEDGDTPTPATAAAPLMDLSVDDIMEATGKARSTVIGWISSGDLNAYKFGREWRITRAAWDAFLAARRNGDSEKDRPKRAAGTVDLGSWRRAR